jgi:hypothetical protein
MNRPPNDSLLNDPRRSLPLAVAGGALKGAIVGLAIGKLALATAAGAAGGAALGALLSWRAKRRKDAAQESVS